MKGFILSFLGSNKPQQLSNFPFIYFRGSLASYILALNADERKRRAHIEKMFFPVFSALLDALLLRTQVSILFLILHVLFVKSHVSTDDINNKEMGKCFFLNLTRCSAARCTTILTYFLAF